MPDVREAAVAGQFYPGNAHELAAAVRGYLADAGRRLAAEQSAKAAPPVVPPVVPKAIIAPHAGYVYSGPIAASAYARFEPAHAVIKRVVLLGPCHRVAVKGLALSGADHFATPLGRVPVDKEASARILDLPQVKVFDATHLMEHSLEVHLPFLQTVLDDFRVVPLVVGEARPEEVAEVLDALWGGPETVIVVSSDLSHYLDYDSARAIDARTCRAIETLDPAAIARDGACGRFPVGGLLAIAKRRGMTVTTLDLRNSGDTAGSKDHVVGYGSWMFVEKPKDQAGKQKPRVTMTWQKKTKTPAQGDDFLAATEALLKRHGATLIHVAIRSILNGLEYGEPLKAVPGQFDAELGRTGAAFVTLKREGKLRGCIGSPEARQPLIVDVAENAYRAAFKDPRFPALIQPEVAGLDLSISVLSPQAPMAFADQADFLARLRPNVDGLVIEDDRRRALFLPSVWEQLPDPKKFVEHLKIKAGLKPGHWSDGFKAWRFAAAEIDARDVGDPETLWSGRA